MSSRGAGVCIFRASPYRKCAWWIWRRPFPSDAARNRASVINGLAHLAENQVMHRIAVYFAAVLYLSAQTGPGGAAPPKTWIDPDTGHRVVRLTDEAGS